MSHNTSSTDELAVASALLNFGSTGSDSTDRGGRPESVVAAPPNHHQQHQGGDASTVGDDSKSYAVVTVASNNSSDDTLSERDGATKKRSSVDLPLLAPAPSSKQSTTSTKRLRAEGGSSSTGVVKGHGNKKEEYIIQDCHAVLGDRHCAGRTTIATVILREIKIKYKDKYKGKGVDNWYDEAMVEYYQRVKEKVPGFTQDDYETVLVYSYSPKGKKRKSAPADAEVASSRIEKPNCYKYHTDDFPKYGKAKVPEAVKFFFNSKDAPTLPKEISKYRSDFEKLKTGSGKQPPPEKMKFFEDFLKFCEENLQKAKDEEMAQQLLHSLNLIPTLRRLWDTLKAASASTTSSSTRPTTTVAQAVLKAKEPSFKNPPQHEGTPHPRTLPTTSAVPMVVPPENTTTKAVAQVLVPSESATETHASSLHQL